MHSFIIVPRYNTAAPLIKELKLKKDMNARAPELFRRGETVLCLCGESPAEHASAVGYLAGRYEITRDKGFKLLYLCEGDGYRLPHTIRGAVKSKGGVVKTDGVEKNDGVTKNDGAENFYPAFIIGDVFETGILDSPGAAAAFEAASRFFSLNDIVIAEAPPDYSAEKITALINVMSPRTASPRAERASRFPRLNVEETAENPVQRNALRSRFPRVYVEEAAFDYPLTRRVLARLPGAQVVTVGHYKDIFNRPGQDTRGRAFNLILAVRRGNFIFPGAAVCDHYGNESFFYSTQMMNCPYRCDYCYLQGMYPSSDIVAFVNTEDYFNAARNINTAYLSVSYDSDLLSLEPLFGYAEGWVNFARENPLLTIEIRTKSAAAGLDAITPAKNVVLAWTVSPRGTALREKNTPPVRKRLEAARAALEAGWRVRLCVDPVLPVDDWEKDLNELLAEIREIFGDTSRLEGIGAGGFRMSKTYFKRMVKNGSELLGSLPLTEADGVMRLNPADKEKIYAFNLCIPPAFQPRRP